MDYSGFTERSRPFAKKIIKFSLIWISVFFTSCGNEGNEHQKGELTIYADPSNRNLLEALTDIYTMKFPEVKFNFVYQSENKILQNLIDTVANAAFINKPLNAQQTRYLKQQTGITPKSSLLAYDAAVFIASKESKIDSIGFEEIKNGILNQQGKIVFNSGNSGNFNTIKEILKLEIPADRKIEAFENTEKLIEFLKKSPESVGVIGLNEISEKHNPKVKAMLSEIKILPVVDSSNLAQMPSIPNILDFRYPFFKGVYFISREPGFGIGSGFARFAGSEQGQLIVGREGLQPNYIFERNVQINLNPLD